MSRWKMSKRKLSVHSAVVSTLGVALCAPGRIAAADDDGPNDDALDGVTDVVVKLAPGQSIGEVNSRHGTQVIDRVSVIRTYLLAPANGSTPLELVRDLETDSALQLEYVEPNYAESQPEGNPTYKWSGGEPVVVGSDPATWRDQRAMRKIGAARAHRTTRGAGTVVAVVDTGFQLDHSLVASRFTRNGYDFVDNDAVPGETLNGLDDDADGSIDEGRGHGTHVAGVVAAVAPQARIMPLRVLDDEGTGYVWTTAEAIRWATARGVDVINLSLGTVADSDLLEDAVEDAEEADVVVVASAGNDGRSRPQYPAAGDDVLAVASVNASDAASPFTNFGAWVDIAAPGQQIVSTFPTSVLARWDGTSMAAPFVAGQVALLRAQDPEADPDQIEARIRQTAVFAGAGLGAGRIDLAASLQP